jgi:hypothetical protein
VDDRRPDLSGQRFSLIEAASHAAPAVKRHGRDTIGIVQQTCAGRSQERAKRAREHSASVVLERLQDVAQRSVVFARRARRVQERRPAATAGAPFERSTDHAPGGKGVTARAAEGRGTETDGAPAGVAHRTLERPLKHHVASGATRRDRGGKERVYP